VWRVWEAYGWCQLGIQIAPDSQELIAELKAFEKALENEPFQLVVAALSPLSKINTKQFVAPKWNLPRRTDIDSVDLNKQIQSCHSFC
jgi:hypothetical protein